MVEGVTEGATTSAAAITSVGVTISVVAGVAIGEAFKGTATVMKMEAVGNPSVDLIIEAVAEVADLGNRLMVTIGEDVEAETLGTIGVAEGAAVSESPLVMEVVGVGEVSVTKGSIRETVLDQSLPKIRRLRSMIRCTIVI